MIYSFPQIITKSAQRFPNREAFRSGKASITYAQLNTKTTQFAQFLIEQGVKKGDRVGVYQNRCLESAIAIYGIMKAGAVYVPLDPTAPNERTLFLLNDCDIKFIISNKFQKRKLINLIKEPSPLKTIIGLSEDWEMSTISWETIYTKTPQPLNINVLEDDLAYIIYTSGSTGTPKGIMHTHRSGLAYAKLTADLYQINENDVIGNHAPLHFDISTLGYFTAPLVGATTVIVPDAYTKLPASLANLIEKERITIWYSVPLALVQILEQGSIDKKDFSALRWILFGGEPFPLKHLRSLMEYLPQATFSNVYGPAEVNQCSFYNFKELAKDEESVPLGKTWNNTEMLIVDTNDKLVQNNEIGELLIRSATRMAGYWNQPELTQRSLFEIEPIKGFKKIYYRTGDLVKLRNDGNLIFCGRKDRQIKVRGYRVELDEVEAVLLKHNRVQEAVTFISISEGKKIIIASAILKPNKNLTPSDLRIFLHQHLVEYAVPSVLTIVDDFPRTSTGKINRVILKKRFFEKNNL